MDRKTIALGLTLSLFFSGLLYLFRDFVLDDAFIIYRYAERLAQGQGILWNLGEDPVEGYTSFLWVVLNAAAIRLGLDPVAFSRALCALSAWGIILALARAGRELPLALAFVFTAALALSPVFALLTMQGMETAAAMLIMTGSAYYLIHVAQTRQPGHMRLWYALTVLGFLARPESAAFAFGAFLGLLLVFCRNRDAGAARSLIMAGLPFAALWCIYMAWRWNYFGWFFPNTFYVKVAAQPRLIKREAALYFLSFFLNVLLPYLVLAAVLLVRHWRRERLGEVLPALLGFICFGSYLFVIIPIQGFLWRFAILLFPAFLLTLCHYFSGLRAEAPALRKAWVSVGLMACFALWSLRLLPQTLLVKQTRSSRDRIVAGKMLKGLPGTMFVSEAGAVPYYSGWRAYDLLGINSEEIAHQGLSRGFLDRVSPDLIMLHELSGFYRPDTKEEGIVNQYMIDRNFAAVAAVRKGPGQYHFYFARRDSPLFREVALRLTGIKGLEYGDLQELMAEKRIPILGPREERPNGF